MQYLRSGSWIDIPGQVKTPNQPRANYNAVHFRELSTPRIRVLLTPQTKSATENYGIGLKEIQVFHTH